MNNRIQMILYLIVLMKLKFFKVGRIFVVFRKNRLVFIYLSFEVQTI